MKKNKQGFTLLELMVNVAILAGLVIVIFSFFTWSVRSSAKISAMREVLDTANLAAGVLSREIKEADSIYYPTSSSTQLSLQTGKYLPAGESASFIDFYLCGDSLCLKKEENNPVAITPDSVEVAELEFTQIATTSAPSVKIYMRLQSTAFGDDPNYSFGTDLNTTASLREL